MSIGIVGKTEGIRWITGSVHYGKRRKENLNLEYRKYPGMKGGGALFWY